MKILVCGSRTFGTMIDPENTDRIIACPRNERVLLNTLEGWYHRWVSGWHKGNKDEMFYVISGMAPGADSIAAAWASRFERIERSRVVLEPYPAKWDEHGRAAGPIRNKLMLEKGKPDVVLAFLDLPFADSKGTRNMVTQSRKAGVLTVVHEVTPYC